MNLIWQLWRTVASLVISCTYCTKMSQAEQKLCIFFSKESKKEFRNYSNGCARRNRELLNLNTKHSCGSFLTSVYVLSAFLCSIKVMVDK